MPQAGGSFHLTPSLTLFSGRRGAGRLQSSIHTPCPEHPAWLGESFYLKCVLTAALRASSVSAGGPGLEAGTPQEPCRDS